MKQRGFTLIEVIIVIAIISLVSIGGVNSYTYFAKQELERFAERTKETIQIMQQSAAMENKTYTFYKKKVNKAYIVQIDCNTTEFLRYDIPDSIEMWIGSADDYIGRTEKIIFAQDMSPSRSGTIVLEHKTLLYHIKITVRPVTGLVTIYDLEKN